MKQEASPAVPLGQWGAHQDCTVINCSLGKIFIEGGVFRVDRRIGRDALVRLAELVDCDGPSALARVEGDFVALIATDDVIYAFKSFTSQYQLYYREADGAVANRLSHFLDVAPPRWNEDYFARHVLIVPGYQFMSAETPLSDVSRVLPGELVCIGPTVTRRQVVRRDYLYRLDEAQRPEDVTPRILATLRDSIKGRLAAYPDAPVCVEISGGLDSSFIACLLAEQTSRIRGVMFSQPNVPSHAVSEDYAREVAARCSIDLAVIAPNELPSEVDQNPGYADEPSDFFWFGDWFSRAVTHVAAPRSLVFTGFGADQLFLRSISFLPYLLRRGEYGQFAKALPAASRLTSRGRANLAWQSVLSLMPEHWYQRCSAAFDGGRWNPLDVGDVNMTRMLTLPVPWLQCGKSLAAYTRERRAWERSLVGDGALCDDWGYFSAPRTVTQSHFAGKRLIDASPYCDLPLLDLVYDEVSALRVHDFEGRYKELLRECQKGIVPETLRNRQNDTFVFNSFQMKYVNQGRDWFLSLIAEAPEGWIDRRAASFALEQLAFGITTSSTRSVMALIGYLSWRQALLAQRSKDMSGLIYARTQRQ